mgnify:CR=1 FL=1
MDSAFIHQAANELVQNAGTRNIKQIARSCSLDISETSRIKDMLGLLSLYFDKPLILINRQLDKQTKQMVCGYALGHYLEHQLLMDLHTLNKFLTIKDKHILLYEHNAFTSHLMLDSDEVYQMTKRGLDAAQISAAKRIHLNLVLSIRNNLLFSSREILFLSLLSPHHQFLNLSYNTHQKILSLLTIIFHDSLICAIC